VDMWQCMHGLVRLIRNGGITHPSIEASRIHQWRQHASINGGITHPSMEASRAYIFGF